MNDNDSKVYPFIVPAATSAITGGCIITLTLTPFDVIKNYWYYNIALSSNRTKVGSVYVVKQIYNTRGIRAFWNGSGWGSANTISGQIIFLCSYEFLKESHNIFLSSICSRIAALTICTPFECIKTWNQANMFDKKTINPIEFFRLRNLNKLYSGFIPTVIRDMPYSAIHWSSYDYMIKKSHDLLGLDDSYYITKYIIFPMICGTISSVLGVIVSHPFDIIKTNIQASIGDPFTKSKSNKLSYFYKELVDMYTNDGFKGLGIGMLPRIARVVPSSAIMMAAYEYCKNFTKRQND